MLRLPETARSQLRALLRKTPGHSPCSTQAVGAKGEPPESVAWLYGDVFESGHGKQPGTLKALAEAREKYHRSSEAEKALYSRVATLLGVTAEHVRQVALGQRRSKAILAALRIPRSKRNRNDARMGIGECGVEQAPRLRQDPLCGLSSAHQLQALPPTTDRSRHFAKLSTCPKGSSCLRSCA